MTTTAILETTKSWASQCFRPEAGQLEVSEKPAPPPFVDLPSDSADRTGVFLGLKHVDGGELQIWIAASGTGSAYCMFGDDESEVETLPFATFGSASELQDGLARVSDRFFLAHVFERALEICLHNIEYGGRFIRPSEFAGDAAHADVNPRDWLFCELATGAEENSPVVVIGVHGSGAAATFCDADNDLGGFLDFDEEVVGLQNYDQLSAWIQARLKGVAP